MLVESNIEQRSSEERESEQQAEERTQKHERLSFEYSAEFRWDHAYGEKCLRPRKGTLEKIMEQCVVLRQDRQLYPLSGPDWTIHK